MKQVLIDTGPLVAILTPQEASHQRCVATLRTLPGPPLTCWPVITEAVWLLRRFPGTVKRLLLSIGSGTLQILNVDGSENESIALIMDRYASLRPQFADAMLVYLAQREGIDTIFTLDRRDFRVYRTARNKAFRLIPD